MRSPFSLAAFILVFAPAAAMAQGPSFDCARAATPDEAAICADPQLSELDRLIASAYAQAHAFRPRIAQAMARNGLANRRACRADRSCILDAQMALIGHYQQPDGGPSDGCSGGSPAAPSEGCSGGSGMTSGLPVPSSPGPGGATG